MKAKQFFTNDTKDIANTAAQEAAWKGAWAMTEKYESPEAAAKSKLLNGTGFVQYLTLSALSAMAEAFAGRGAFRATTNLLDSQHSKARGFGMKMYPLEERHVKMILDEIWESACTDAEE